MKKNSVVLYKNFGAVVTEQDGDKFLIKYCSVPATPTGKKAVYSEQKVREKDVIVLHEGPASSLEKILSFTDEAIESQIMETCELLASDEETASASMSFEELVSLIRGENIADEAYFIYTKLSSDIHFNMNQEALKKGELLFSLRTQEEIDSINQKNYEKEHEAEIRNAFINRLKQKKLELPGDSKFMGEVEAFALCKTEKSKTLAEAGFSQSIEKAHQLLIDTEIWDMEKNPYPTRFGFSFDSAREQLGRMPEEERIDCPCVCYAIDAPNAADPDDAVGFDGTYYWVCIADPASSVAPDSSIDMAARGRGTTLYIPEGASRMLCESSLEDYALGLKEDSKALAFRLTMSEDSQIEECVIMKVNVQVKMISYEEAEQKKDTPELKPLFELARKNLKRRTENNAVNIQMPEVHIKVDKETKKVSIEPHVQYESNAMIQEMMLLAGEGAAKFAFKNQLPFPFVSQEAPEFPENVPEGWAGEFARVKCMRKRSVGITPAPHAGLGLSFYSQVTSPLRRYSDLVAHQQLRAFIDGRKVLGKDEMLERIAAGDAASLAAKKASRLSDTHWKLVYLLQNPDLEYEAFCIDKRGNDALMLIPSLDMQTTLKGFGEINLNDKVCVKCKAVNIPLQEVEFIKL
ncbi:MAG: RNB domain-containing ribonuclease [Treponema sp.]|nr:RNB domain-containing ribonuclease [Treponema sp.]